MAEPKMKETDASVDQFLAAVSPEKKRRDAITLCELMKKVTKLEPKLWGPTIIGFGSYHYKYESGHEGDAPLAGFSPRKQHLVVYLMPGFADHDAALLAKLGKHKTSKVCLYINKLDDVDLPTLRELIKRSFVEVKKQT
ncbi:MAG TPA: DUF1801 domain-containing protein [Myxococcaceae bacterium]|jgi:uncharacterized protein YdhG (YjbR/CyaY superfamily)